VLSANRLPEIPGRSSSSVLVFVLGQHRRSSHADPQSNPDQAASQESAQAGTARLRRSTYLTLILANIKRTLVITRLKQQLTSRATRVARDVERRWHAISASFHSLIKLRTLIKFQLLTLFTRFTGLNPSHRLVSHQTLGTGTRETLAVMPLPLCFPRLDDAVAVLPTQLRNIFAARRSRDRFLLPSSPKRREDMFTRVVELTSKAGKSKELGSYWNIRVAQHPSIVNRGS
jgi:hypothetical protein